MNVSIKVSVGELLDKISILSIKAEKIHDRERHTNVCYEHSILCEVLEDIKKQFPRYVDDLDKSLKDLEKINTKLWEVEDDIRACENVKDFGEAFVNLARQVYKLNDERSQAKYEINKKVRSRVVEEKLYTKYE
jgi:hypothetical protein